jgi:hypothetical protein
MTARALSPWGGHRPDGTYAEGPSGLACPLGRWAGAVQGASQRASDQGAHEVRQAIVRRRARQAQPAPALPHPRRCKKAVRCLGGPSRG